MLKISLLDQNDDANYYRWQSIPSTRMNEWMSERLG